MFFLLNNENIVIAADDSFLKHMTSESIFDLARIDFEKELKRSDQQKDIFHLQNKDIPFEKILLQTVWGELALYKSAETHSEQEEPEHPEPEATEQEESEEDMLAAAAGLGAAGIGGAFLIDDSESEPKEAITEDTAKDDALSPDDLRLHIDEKENAEDELPSLLEPDVSAEETGLGTFDKESVPEISEEPEEKHDDFLDFDLPDLTQTAEAKTDEAKKQISESKLSEIPDILEISEFKEPEETDEKPAELLESTKDISDQSESSEALPDLIEPDLEREIDLVSDKADKGFELLDLEEKAADTVSTEQTESEPEPEERSYSRSFFADYEDNARLIGITSSEYYTFLKQFTDEALASESGLRSNDFYVFKNSLVSIRDTAQLLHLPGIYDGLKDIEDLPSEEKSSRLDTFFEHIRHIRKDIETVGGSGDVVYHEDEAADEIISSESVAPEPEETATEDTVPPEEETEEKTPVSFDLTQVEPIAFDFSAKTAADELGLPEELVKEFVSDFLGQAKENISVFKEAEEKGDMTTIQKTAHLLKGAAGNLRIDALADTLETIQHNEEKEKVPELINTFLGQLKMLENFISKQG